jgi:putative NIF3 family GTP cyclohydrolase 1 type 2
MQAKEIQYYLRSLNGGWMDLDKTVDTFKAGSPDTEITGIAVAWMSTIAALNKAMELDCNVFITHEPTYYNHYDAPDSPLFQLEGAHAKRAFVQHSGLVIIRCHDLWDQVPGMGIPDSWGSLLELGEVIGGTGYYRVYDVSGHTAGSVARKIAQKTGQFGQPDVQLIGNPDRQVTRAAIGTGAITPLFGYITDYAADLGICTDDGFTYWQHGAYALDHNLPVIVVNHAVSEEMGMMNLAQHLALQFPDLRIHHIPQGCLYSLISASG